MGGGGANKVARRLTQLLQDREVVGSFLSQQITGLKIEPGQPEDSQGAARAKEAYL